MSIFSEIPSRRRGDASGAATDANRSPETISIAMYIACAIVQIAGLTVVAYQVAEPSFTAFTIGMTLLGTTLSYFMRRRGANRDLLKLGGVALAVVFFYVLRRLPLFEMLVPSENNLTPEVVLVCALALTSTFGSFLLVTDDALLFACVWTIAIIGLTGTVNVNRELPISFVVFLLAAAFLLVHQNAARLSRSSQAVQANDGERLADVSRPGVADQFRLLRAHLITAFAAWGAALILGSAIAIPLQMLGRNLSLATILQRLRAPLTSAGHAGSPPRLTFNSLHQFSVGLGPVDDDSTPHLSVLSDGPHYWRGRTYSIYTGHGWDNSERMDYHGQAPESKTPNADNLFTYSLPTQSAETNEQPALHATRIVTNFHSLENDSPLFYAASEPVRILAPVSSLLVYNDRTFGNALVNASDYEIVSQIADVRPSALRRTGTQYPLEVRERYISTGPPDEVLQDISQLATAGAANNPYDRVSAIKRFIASRCTYSQQARAVPPDRDAVEFFLNETHEGYCDLYASAMVVLCRYAGIPARVATGYAPGTPVPDNGDFGPPAAKGDKRIRYVLRGNDLHAWAEVYFTGYGWIVFDATDSTSGVTPPASTPLVAPKRSGLWHLFHNISLPILMVSLAAILAVFTIGNELRLRHLTGFSGKVGGWRASRKAREATMAYRTAVRLLTRRGVKRPPTMSAGEYARAVEAKFGSATASALRRLAAVEDYVLYADPATPDAPDAPFADVPIALRDLRESLKRQRKDNAEAAS